jgi:hypothetical protein
VVFPDPGWPVMMMHFGFLFMFLDAHARHQTRAHNCGSGKYRA